MEIELLALQDEGADAILEELLANTQTRTGSDKTYLPRGQLL
jgi:hypothetical protein